jgi:hypothetical protein
MVPERAQHVLGLEGNHVHARRLAVKVCVPQPALLGGNDQRGLGGVALHLGPPVLAPELRIVAKHAGAQAFGERGMLGALSWNVLWPPPRGVEPGNAASIVLEVQPGTGCVRACLSGVLLGDLGAESQARLLGAVRLHRVDVVKVAHHGSADQSAALYEALREGHAYIALESGQRADGFTFSLERSGTTVAIQGDALHWERDFELVVRVPEAARIMLLRDGHVIETRETAELRYLAAAPGVYRVEVERRNRPWIFSNPIYLREPPLCAVGIGASACSCSALDLQAASADRHGTPSARLPLQPR